MTKLIIDLSDVAGGTHPDDKVVVWSPVHREGSAGRTVAPTPYTIPLTDGRGESEVEPGPLMVQTQVRAIADTRAKEVIVPDQASVTLWELLEQVFQWTPPLVNRALQAIIDALENALADVSDAVDTAIDQRIDGKADITYVDRKTEESSALALGVAGAALRGTKNNEAGGSGSPTGVTPFARNQHLKTKFIYEMGGPIDTGGLGAVAFRMDHGLKNFKEYVLPLCRKYGIVPSMVYNPRDWGRSENEGVTAAELNQWVADGEVEIWNHGAHHRNAHTDEEVYDTIVNGLHEIEAELPAAAGKVWGFAPPGVGLPGYGGFSPGSEPDNWDTYGGRLILESHAIGAGMTGGTSTRILDGVPRDGLAYYGLGRQDLDTITRSIDLRISNRTGVEFMYHPSRIGQEGYITVDTLDALFAYVAQKRDAGELVVLSPYQILLADSTGGAGDSGLRVDSTVGSRVLYGGTGLTGDTGWRDMTESETLTITVASGSVYLRRTESMAHLYFDNLVIDDSGSSTDMGTNFLPVGFRNSLTAFSRVGPLASGEVVRLTQYGGLRVENWVPGNALVGMVSFPVGQDWPSTLPGTPV